MLAHVNPSELAYNEIYPYGYPRRSMAYTGFHLEGNPFGKPPEKWRLAHYDSSESV